MLNFKNAKENTMKGIGKHSTLITFALTAVGMAATIYFAAKEVPKAQQEVKAILAKEDLTKKQKVVESAKTVVKTTWKTFVIALGTVLLVTGTNAISMANSAATVAGMTNTIGMLETKVKDYQESIDESTNKKAKEEIKNNVNQKAVNRATCKLTAEDYLVDGNCPDMYIWVDTWTGVKFKATFQMIDNATEFINLRMGIDGYQTVFDFYEELHEQGAIFLEESYPQLCSDHAWTHSMSLDKDVYLNDKGYTVHTISYSEPSMDF